MVQRCLEWYFTALGGCTGSINNEIKEWQGVGSTKQRDGVGQTSGSCTASRKQCNQRDTGCRDAEALHCVETGTRDNGVDPDGAHDHKDEGCMYEDWVIAVSKPQWRWCR